jgi:hypothetical protein
MNDLLAQIAAKEVGTKEQGGNNKGPRIREYQSATWLAPAPWPWCAAFVDWCLREWLKSQGVKDWLKLTDPQAEDFRPKTAGAWDLVNWARDHKDRVSIFTEDAKALPGDIIVFDFSHVGLIESDQGNHFNTIEGNTNNAGTRDSDSGDGVWRKTRARSLAKNLLRVHPIA